MNETYQNRITDQICKIQNDRALIAFYDRLRYAPLGNYAQLHAKGEYQENGHKVHSLICITIQDYSNGTGDRNIITRFNLAPEQIQFLLTRITSGFQEFEWSQSKIYGNPDQNGYSTAQMFYISRHPYDSKGQPMKSPWKIQIVNGKGIKAQNKNGGSYMQPRSFQSEKTTAIQLTDMDLFTLLKRTDSYISNWETVIAASLINNGKRMLADQQNSQMQQTAQAPPYACLNFQKRSGTLLLLLFLRKETLVMNIALIRTMDSQGRIVIPAEIRKQMKLSDGDALELENVGMELLLRKCPTHLNGKEEMVPIFPSSTVSSTVVSQFAVRLTYSYLRASIFRKALPLQKNSAELVADGQELISAENCPVYPYPTPVNRFVLFSRF